jgi:hypothetical protein
LDRWDDVAGLPQQYPGTAPLEVLRRAKRGKRETLTLGAPSSDARIPAAFDGAK